MQIALNVIRAYTDHVEPCPGEVATLKSHLGAEADSLDIDDLAREVIERCVYEARSRATA